MTKGTLRCPDCKRQVAKVHLMRTATDVLRRTCKCGQTWQIILRPLIYTEDVKAHQCEWVRI